MGILLEWDDLQIWDVGPSARGQESSAGWARAGQFLTPQVWMCGVLEELSCFVAGSPTHHRVTQDRLWAKSPVWVWVVCLSMSGTEPALHVPLNRVGHPGPLPEPAPSQALGPWSWNSPSQALGPWSCNSPIQASGLLLPSSHGQPHTFSAKLKGESKQLCSQ